MADISIYTRLLNAGLQTALDGKTYTIQMMASAFSPTSAQTIVAGYYPGLAPSTSVGARRMIVPKTGSIVSASINMIVNGTMGTNESWAMSIRQSDGTVTAIASVASTSSQRLFHNTALSIPVTAGDYFEIQLVNPTWATPPTNVNMAGVILIK